MNGTSESPKHVPPNSDPDTESPKLSDHPAFEPPAHIKHAHRFIYGYLLLLVLVAAVAGILAWQHGKQHASSSAAVNASPTTTQQKSTTSAQLPPTTNITIKEWGVKLPLSSTTSDAYYTVCGSNTGADGLPNTAWLGLTSTNSGGCDVSSTGPSSTAKPIGSIVRVLPTDRDPVSGTLYTQQDPNGTTIGNYYYAYAPWKNKTCASQATLQAIDSAFSTAIKSMVAAGHNWQVYKSTFGGFQFIYPSDWKVTEGVVPTGTDHYINIEAPTFPPGFQMQLEISSNQDIYGPPTEIPSGSTQQLTNAIQLWTVKQQNSLRNSGESCPTIGLVNSNLTHMSVALPNGKYLALNGGYCGERYASSLSYQQQLASEDWQTAITIVQWIQWTP